MGLLARRLAVLASILAPPALHAQLAPVGVPAGVLRVELDGAFQIWDQRWRDGAREALGSSLTSPAVGSNLFPSLADADTRIGRLTGVADYRLNLGTLATDAQAEDNRVFFGAALGLTRSLTLFGRMPLVRVRTQASIALTPTPASDAGLNPGAAQQAAFFQELDASLTALGARIAAGEFDADPALKARAQTTLDGGGALRADLFGLLADPATAAPFVPRATSVAGAALTSRVADLQSTLAADFGVGGFTATPALPSDPVTSEALLAAISDPFGAIAARAGETKITFRGDAEVGLAFTVIDRWDRGRARGGARLAAEGLVRLPTGRVARLDRLLALGTGDGQTDVEVRLTADVGSGRWGLRAEGAYNRQLAADYLARVAPPTQPLAAIALLSSVRRDPGDVVSLTVRPFFRLAPTLAIQGSATRWSRGADAVTYSTDADAIPGVDPAVLALDSKASATVLGIGLTYSNPGRRGAGGAGWPLDASWGYERIVTASGGIVPDMHVMRTRLRFYFGLF